MEQIAFRTAKPEDNRSSFRAFASTRSAEMVLAGWIDEKKYFPVKVIFESRKFGYSSRRWL